MCHGAPSVSVSFPGSAATHKASHPVHGIHQSVFTSGGNSKLIFSVWCLFFCLINKFISEVSKEVEKKEILDFSVIKTKDFFSLMFQTQILRS